MPNGSLETFDLAVGTMPIYIYRTKLTDPKGNALSFTYDSTNRLTAVTDAIGQVTTLSYELGADNLKITKVTDPFGRYATFQYNGSGQLTNITDVIGISSGFTYSTNDFINAMTTPYGTTGFNKTEVGTLKRLEVTDPLGAKERMDYVKYAIGSTGPTNQVPTGLNTYNSSLDVRNSFFWDKKAMAEHPGDYNWAQITHWTGTPEDWYVVSEVPESTKMPLENRVWYNYPGQANAYTAGTSSKPTKIARCSMMAHATLRVRLQFVWADHQRH